MCLKKKLSSKQGKKQQRIGTKSFYSNTSYDFEYKKTASVNCLLKSSYKEKQKRAEKAYVY